LKALAMTAGVTGSRLASRISLLTESLTRSWARNESRRWSLRNAIESLLADLNGDRGLREDDCGEECQHSYCLVGRVMEKETPRSESGEPARLDQFHLLLERRDQSTVE
jgi:hypothetical protein